jgi:hypothetical protein
VPMTPSLICSLQRMESWLSSRLAFSGVSRVQNSLCCVVSAAFTPVFYREGFAEYAGKFKLIGLLFFLCGCITSSTQFFSPSDAVYPLPNGVQLEHFLVTYESGNRSKVERNTDNSYHGTVRLSNGYYEFRKNKILFIKYNDDAFNSFILQVSGINDRGEISHFYQFARIADNRLFIWNLSVARSANGELFEIRGGAFPPDGCRTGCTVSTRNELMRAVAYALSQARGNPPFEEFFVMSR